MSTATISRAAAVVDAAEELELRNADASSDGDLVVGVHGERDHAVDVLRLEACVVQSVDGRLAGELQLRAPGLFRELGCPDAGDGGPHGSVSSTVPVTWSPRLLRPATSTVTTPSALFVTRPLIRIVSYG